MYILNFYNGIDVYLLPWGRYGNIYCEGGALHRTLHQKYRKNYLTKPKYLLKKYNNITFWHTYTCTITNMYTCYLKDDGTPLTRWWGDAPPITSLWSKNRKFNQNYNNILMKNSKDVKIIKKMLGKLLDVPHPL